MTMAETDHTACHDELQIIELFHSTRLTFRGHLYQLHTKNRHGRHFWRCSEISSLRCNSRLHTDNGELVKILGEHNHKRETEKVEKSVGKAKRICGNLVASMSALQPHPGAAGQLQSIAPAPQQQQQQPQGAQQMIQTPTGQQIQHTITHSSGYQPQQQQQVITSMSAQHLPQMGQFQVIQQPYGASHAGTPQFTTSFPFASLNEQGQLILPPGVQLAQQPGFILTTGPTQKSGQPTQMIGSPANNQGNKSMSQAIPGIVQASGASGVQYVYATNPVGNIQQSPQAASNQSKQMDQKPITNNSNPQSMAQAHMNTQSMQTVTTAGSAAQPIYMSQHFLPNGHVVFRPATAQDQSTQQLIFSPTGQPLAQQQQIQGVSPGLVSSLPQTLQSMSVPTSSAMRPPSNGPAMPPPGKTPIPRNFTSILPNSSPSRPSYQVPNMPGLGGQQQRGGSPKSKSAKMSPRGGSGQVGRPPGPSKSALNVLKTATSNSASTPTLPNSPGQPASPQTNSGPPVLQQSSQLPMISQSQSPSLYAQPPKLQPMLPVTSTVASSTSSTVDLSSATKNQANSKLNSSSPTKTAQEDKKKTPETENDQKPSENGVGTPKAVVKPNVLTHVIDGHLIMESSAPFPVDREDKGNTLRNRRKAASDVQSNGKLDDIKLSKTPESQNGVTSIKSAPTTPVSKQTTPGGQTEVKQKARPGRPKGSTKEKKQQQMAERAKAAELANQQQQHQDHSPSKKSKFDFEEETDVIKPFGSANGIGSKKQEQQQQQQQKQKPEQAQTLEDQQKQPQPQPKPKRELPPHLRGNPLKWTVDEVCDFIKHLAGCSEYVEDFMLQEIDGQALMLLKTEHLMSAMQIKLGPALKIASAVNELREEMKLN